MFLDTANLGDTKKICEGAAPERLPWLRAWLWLSCYERCFTRRLFPSVSVAAASARKKINPGRNDKTQ